MNFGIHVAVPLVRPTNAIPKDPFGFGYAGPPGLPYPNPYTLPLGQADTKRSAITLVGAALGAGILAAVFGGSRKGAFFGAAIGAAAGGFGAAVVANQVLKPGV